MILNLVKKIQFKCLTINIHIYIIIFLFKPFNAHLFLEAPSFNKIFNFFNIISFIHKHRFFFTNSNFLYVHLATMQDFPE